SCHAFDLFFGARQADGVAAVEGVDVRLEDLGRIAMRVDADENDPDMAGGFTKVLHNGGKGGHGGGADVRATGVTEEHHDHLALEVFLGQRFLAGRHQFKFQVGKKAPDGV